MVKIRLKRMGATKRPFYRVVVADSRSPRDGRFIELIGRYHPLEEPSLIEIDQDRALYWLSQGAQPTEQVVNLLRIQGIWERFEGTRAAPAPSRKAKQKSAAREKARTTPASPQAVAPEPAPEPAAPAREPDAEAGE
ncbi:MAG TPA: 30S ribosomal protein S16 [Actinomycetota bacterium]|nr:30S ribosomal protein S16 [Actinomycetota bacterium]